MSKVIIYNTKCSNILSVAAAVNFLGYEFKITSDKNEIKKYNKVIVPGVGNFGYVMNSFTEDDKYFFNEYFEKNNLILGICLGMQLFLTKSEEDFSKKGLSLFEGKVSKFKVQMNEYLPHISWKKLKIIKEDPIFKNISNDEFYFIHSYFCNLDTKYILANSSYGNFEFPSVIKKKNCYAFQFHPEKSKKSGLNMIKNFLDL